MSSFLTRLRAEWAPSIPRELLAGAVATFALIPEVIAFSFVAGVDPSVGLFASFVIGIVMSFPVPLLLLIWPAQPNQMIAVVTALATAAAVVDTVSRFKSSAWQAWVAPTWLGTAGGVLMYMFRDGVQF